ncbi:MAG: DNA replication/repair protein RecF [Anaerolineae bacterium]
MVLTRLSLTNFRNYLRLSLDLPPGPVLLRSDNAQGKTNLLEAIYYLATTRSTFARAERQLVNWQALERDPLPFARLEGHVRRGTGTFQIDITLLPAGQGTVRKEMRLNGVRKRALDIVGQLNAVIFLPEDIELVTGAPGVRRRYLDVTLCQIDPTYCRALAQYNKLLVQRNALLKQLAERSGGRALAPRDEDQLLFWDEQLAEQGATLIVARQEAVSRLDQLGRGRYRLLGEQSEVFRLHYAPSFDPQHRPLLDYQRPLSLEELLPSEQTQPSRSEVAEAFKLHLRQARREELARGMTVVGPHRDDLHFTIGGVDMTLYGSRGQQRTTALALKLAEVDFMRQVTGEAPLLLLDDVMSELDARRRARVMAMVDGVEQAILTTTDWADFSPEFCAQACLLQLTAGYIEEASRTDG